MGNLAMQLDNFNCYAYNIRVLTEILNHIHYKCTRLVLIIIASLQNWKSLRTCVCRKMFVSEIKFTRRRHYEANTRKFQQKF